MDKIIKHNYEVPSVKVVSFNVEGGFAGTTRVGDRTSTEEYPNGINGIETFESGDSWTVRPYSPSSPSQE